MAQLGSLSAETETLSHVSRLVEAFRAFDSDNDGSITAAELRGIMSSLGCGGNYGSDCGGGNRVVVVVVVVEYVMYDSGCGCSGDSSDNIGNTVVVASSCPGSLPKSTGEKVPGLIGELQQLILVIVLVYNLVHLYNPSEEDVEAMMQKGDKNKDGVLSIEEFLEMNTNELGLGGLQIHLTIALQALDVADDEDLTAKELHEVLGNMQGGDLSLNFCEEVIASMDRDDDGAISFEDFKLIVNALL
ncbi:hypothetical protein HYC85_007777 [Camellia sinensis]|uniref:EF-hand domain-containing protein n=1 Tax=Camellia sinensis TaxID=4442 RepID=A0A7J7HRT0_CAMSI|nr:hypothetical protein HYC85_007777 [Camellia sinensis]